MLYLPNREREPELKKTNERGAPESPFLVRHVLGRSESSCGGSVVKGILPGKEPAEKPQKVRGSKRTAAYPKLPRSLSGGRKEETRRESPTTTPSHLSFFLVGQL
jgi:hypothetical protein